MGTASPLTNCASHASPTRAAVVKSPSLGPYTVVRALGHGGMGVAYLTERVVDGERRSFVVKTLHRSLADTDASALFAAEAGLGARFTHPNLCPVVDVGVAAPGAGVDTDAVAYFAMEHHAGMTVARLRGLVGGPLPPLVAALIVDGAARGLSAARVVPGDDGAPLDVVHCDVSHDNLFVTDDGVVKVLDFGVAEVRSAAPGRRIVRGKRRFIAPERLRGEPIDERADVFSLGAVFYELLAGVPLFDREVPAVCLDVQRRRVPPLPPSTPPPLVRLVQRMLCPDVSQRPRLADVLDGLVGYLADAVVDVSDDARALARGIDDALVSALTTLEGAPVLDELVPTAADTTTPLPPPDATTARVAAGPPPRGPPTSGFTGFVADAMWRTQQP